MVDSLDHDDEMAPARNISSENERDSSNSKADQIALEVMQKISDLLDIARCETLDEARL